MKELIHKKMRLPTFKRKGRHKCSSSVLFFLQNVSWKLCVPKGWNKPDSGWTRARVIKTESGKTYLSPVSGPRPDSSHTSLQFRPCNTSDNFISILFSGAKSQVIITMTFYFFQTQFLKNTWTKCADGCSIILNPKAKWRNTQKKLPGSGCTKLGKRRLLLRPSWEAGQGF